MTHLCLDAIITVYNVAGGHFSAANFICDRSVLAHSTMNLSYMRTGITNVNFSPPAFHVNYNNDEAGVPFQLIP